MSEIVRTFGDFYFHIVKENDQIWWWGKEVAEVLGYKLPRKAIRDHIKDDEKRLVDKPPRRFGAVVRERLSPRNGEIKPPFRLGTVVSNYKTRAYQINESGLYRLIFSSKLSKAEDFRKWVFNEVLPSIRKTGGYTKSATNRLCIRNETDLHYELVKEIRKRFPHFVLIVQAGELQDTSEKRIDMWSKGFVGGQPDILVSNPHRFYNGLCIELKSPGGTGMLSNKQRDVLDRYTRMGWKTIVCDDLVSTVLELVEYAKGVREICQYCKRSKRLFKTKETLGRHLKFFHRHD